MGLIQGAMMSMSVDAATFIRMVEVVRDELKALERRQEYQAFQIDHLLQRRADAHADRRPIALDGRIA